MLKKKKKKEFNDLLIPVILTIAVLPFITRLIMYSCGFSKYPWYSDYDILSDFFSFYKSYFFMIITIAAAIILIIYYLLYRSSFKNMRLFIPLGFYSVFILLSSVFTVDRQSTFTGGYAHFESVFILLGYMILCLYSYQLMKSEADIRAVIKAVTISAVFMCIIGLFQMAGHDLITSEAFGKLIIPDSYREQYMGAVQNQSSTNAVSLTLFNSNYASVYLSMLIPLFTVMMLFRPGKREKAAYAALIGLMFLLQFKTYSRTGLVSLFISFLILGYFCHDRIKLFWKPILGILMGCFCLFILVDSQSDFRFLTKIKATFQSFNKEENRNSLEEIKTLPDRVYIRYKGEELFILLSPDSTNGSALRFCNGNGADITNTYDRQKKTLDTAPFNEITFYEEKSGDQTIMAAEINRNIWRFYQDNNQGYLYLNDFGKPDRLDDVEKAGFENLEHIASGRGYIWSRSIPLLKDHLLIGSGPDTFPVVFPQSDYVGKANNCKTPYTLIEKPHNLYLMIGIQTGVLSLIAFLCFCFLYLYQSFRLYHRVLKSKTATGKDDTVLIGLGCMLAAVSYLVSGLFNDSSLQTSPVFWVLTGIGMTVNHMLSGQEKERITYADQKRRNSSGNTR